MPNFYERRITSLSPSIWLKFDETSGALTNSGSVSFTNVPNALTQNQDTIVSNKSAYFNGTSSYVALRNWATNVMNDRIFTVETWFKAPTVSTIGTIYAFHSDAGVEFFQAYLNGPGANAGKLTVFMSNYNPPTYSQTNRIYTSTARYDDNVWHHLVVTQTATNIKVYIDKNLVYNQSLTAGSPPFDNSGASAFAKAIGGYPTGSGFLNNYYFKGWIDEFAIYTGELTQAQIDQNYNSRMQINRYASAVLDIQTPRDWWRLDETTGDILTNSGTNSAATLNLSGSRGTEFSTVVEASAMSGTAGIQFNASFAGYDVASNNTELPAQSSISFWFRRAAVPATATQWMYAFQDSNNKIDTVSRARVLNTGQLCFNPTIGGTTGTEISTVSNICDNLWHHITITRNAGTFRMYLDGVLKSTATNYGTAGQFYGSFNFGQASSFFDEFSIFTKTLSDAEVLTLFQAGPNVIVTDTPATASALMVNPFIGFINNINMSVAAMTCSALFVNPIISTNANIAAAPFTSSSEFVSPTIVGTAEISVGSMDASADSGDHKVIHLHFRNFVRTDAFVQGVDAYYNLAEIKEHHQNTNYWNDAEQHIVTIQNTTNNSDIKVLFKPDLNNLTANDIHDVLMFVAGMNNVTGKLVWKRITQAFNLSTVTWHNQPTSVIAQDDDIEYTFYNNGTPTEIVITDLYKNLLQNTNYGFSVEFKDIRTVNLDMDNYGINLDIYTYSQPINIDFAADVMEATLATMPDSLIDATSTVSVAWLPATASAEFVNPTLIVDHEFFATAITASALFVDPVVVIDASNLQTVWTASAQSVMPAVSISKSVDAGILIASAQMQMPALSLDFNYQQDHITIFAESGDHDYVIEAIPQAGTMEATADMVNGVVVSVTMNFAAPFEANAESVMPALSLGVNFLVPPFNGNTETFVAPIISTQSFVSIGAMAFNATALFVAPVVSGEAVFAAAAATASSELVNPMIQINDIELVAPMTASALFNNVSVSGDALHDADHADALATSPDAVGGVWDGYAAEVMTAFAFKTIKDQTTAITRNLSNTIIRTDTSYFEPYGSTVPSGSTSAIIYNNDQLWINDYLSFKRWSSPWHNIVNRNQADAVYPNPSNLHIFPISQANNIDSPSINFPAQLGFGPGGDDTYYVLKDLSFIGDDSFTTVGKNATDFSTTINPINNKSINLPHIYLEENIGEGANYVAPINLCKGFHYEFLINPSVSNCILASGGAKSKERSEAYITEIRLENGKFVFEYIVFDSDTYVQKQNYKFISSTTVPLNQWSHLTVQTNRNNGFYQDIYGQNTRDTSYKILDPISLNNDQFLSVELFINGNIEKKGAIKFPELLDDTKTTSIGVIQMLGRRFGGAFTGQSAGSGQFLLTERSTDRDLDFQGLWGGMMFAWTQTATNRMIGATTNDYIDNVVTLSAKDIRRMSNLALRIPLNFVDSASASAQMIQPEIITNTKKVLRLYWFGNDNNNEMFGVNTNSHEIVTYSVINEISTDNNLLLNADKAFSGGYANPDTASTEIIVDAWRNNDGYKRFINLQSDISEYADIDAIVFMDYPDDSVDWNNLIPGYAPQWISDQYDLFLSSLKTAMQDGKGLFISSSRLAKDLKIVKAIQEVSQEVEASVSPSDPFNDDLGDKHYDASRNNKYRIVGIEDDLTSLASFIMTDVIAHTGDVSDDYHIKYANRPNGLNIGDKFIIPSLPLMPSQLVRDTAGDTSNRIGENTLEVFNESDILAGKAIAKLGDTNYVTTIILEPGDMLDGQIINSKVIVNCVEDGLTMGLEEYNKGKMQIVSVNDADESSNTIQWQYSTSRTKKQLSEMNSIVSNLNTYGQTYPSEGGGGGIVQAPTHSSGENIRSKFDKSKNTFASGIYYDVNSEKFDLETIPVYSMTYRGINWLLNPTDRTGKFVGQSSALAQAQFKNPTTTAIIVDPLPAINKVVTATAMAANGVIVTNIKALFGNANSIVLTLHHQDVITLYITKERL